MGSGPVAGVLGGEGVSGGPDAEVGVVSDERDCGWALLGLGDCCCEDKQEADCSSEDAAARGFSRVTRCGGVIHLDCRCPWR